MKMKNLLAVLTALMFFTSAAAAQPVNQSQTQVDPGFLPGNPFYALENFVESLEIGIASAIGGPDMKAKALANNAEERLAEARALSGSNNSEKVAELVQNYDRTMNRSMEAASERKNPELREKLQNITQKNVEVLEEVKTKVPEHAREAIQKAIDRSNRTPPRGPSDNLPGGDKAGKEGKGFNATPGKSGGSEVPGVNRTMNGSLPAPDRKADNITERKDNASPRKSGSGSKPLGTNNTSDQGVRKNVGPGQSVNGSTQETGGGTGSADQGSTDGSSGGTGTENPAETVTDSQDSVLN